MGAEGGDGGGVELVWPGKYVDGERAPLPETGARLRERERFGDPPTAPADALILGDNLLALEALVRDHAGSVDLVYIDPPFATGGRFALARRVGDKQAGDEQELRLPAFDDAWEGGAAGFLRMLDPRLRLIHQLLAPTGSLYVHVDPTIGHAVKLLLDEIFGPACFQREIVWRIGWLSGFKTKARNWIRNHDLIFFYTKDPRRFTFNKSYVPHPEGYRRRDGKPSKAPGVPIEDVWNANAVELELSGAESLDSIQIKSFSREKTGWATQKNQSVLRRIIEASSAPGDLVADLFAGSGTTAVVAAELDRRFLACDHAEAAVQISRCRLLDAGVEDFRVLELDASELRGRLAAIARVAEAPAEDVLQRWLLAQLEAEPDEALAAGLGPLCARRGEVGVALGLPGTPVDAEQLAAARAQAEAAGLSSVEFLAFDWALACSRARRRGAAEDRPATVELVALEPTRGLFEASVRARSWIAGGLAIRERPELVLAVDDQDQGLRVELCGLLRRRPDRLPEALRERDFAEGLLAWSVADADAPTRPLVHRQRARGRGELELVAELPRPRGGALVIAVEDLLGARHLRRLEL